MVISATSKASHTLRVTQKVPAAVALAFLRGDPRENVFLISRIQRSGMEESRHPAHGRFVGAFDEDQSLRGLLFLGNTGTLIISVDEPWVAGEFVDHVLEAGYQFSICIYEFHAGREFLTKYKKRSGRKPLLDRKQTYYSIDSSTLTKKGIKEIDMEQASLDSIDELTDLACDMVAEDLKLDVDSVDRRHYRLRMTEKVVEGRAFLCRGEAGAPVFKADMAVAGSEGGLLEGVFTPKEHRRSGIATRALWTLSKDLLSREKVPFIALHVDERNKAARRAYENVGFREIASYRLTLLPAH
jgi:GNAT superfamily N-acetyltransferase